MRFAETQPETELRFTTFKYDPQNWRLKTTVPKKSLKLCKIENVTSDKFWEKIRMKVLGWKVAELLRPIKTKIFDELNNKIKKKTLKPKLEDLDTITKKRLSGMRLQNVD